MSKVRVIQVGTGGFGQSWLKILQNYPDAELVAVVDIIPENRRKAKEITGLNDEAFYEDLDEVFTSVDADMVSIITPPSTHKDIAVKALQSGYHVMMEKPITHTYGEAVELLKASRQSEKKVMISQNYRWRSPIQTIKKLLDEHSIGKVGYIEYEFRKAMKFGGWRDHYSEILLEDMSIHHFDIMRYLLDSNVKKVVSQSFRPSWSWFSGNPSANVSIQFQDGVYVSYFGSWVSRGKETTWNGDIRVVGEKGAIELIDDKVSLQIVHDTEELDYKQVDVIDMTYDDREASLDDMVQSILYDRTPETSIEDNIYSFELTCAAIHSARTDEKVYIDDFSKLAKEQNEI